MKLSLVLLFFIPILSTDSVRFKRQGTENSLRYYDNIVNPLRCRTNIGQKGSCVDQSLCKNHSFSASPQCSSSTGRKVICCQGLETQPVTISKTCGVVKSAMYVYIRGGKESTIKSWPWMVSVYEGNEFLCGGSLVNSRYVITAAHCFLDSLPKPQARRFFVRFGEFDLTTDVSGELTQESSLIAIKIHPNYSPPSAANDIALLQLPYAVGFEPVCLPEPRQESETFIGLDATVTGWGALQYNGPQAMRLQEVTIPVVSNDECNESYKRILDYTRVFPNGINEKFLCAGVKSGGKDACQGDSGGPLVTQLNGKQWTLIGIVATGLDCGLPGYPGIYTRVTEFLPWINLNTH